MIYFKLIYQKIIKQQKRLNIIPCIKQYIDNYPICDIVKIIGVFIGEVNEMKNDKKNDIFEVIKDARTNPIQQIETMASELHKTEHISPLDACKCTGNCGAM